MENRALPHRQVVVAITTAPRHASTLQRCLDTVPYQYVLVSGDASHKLGVRGNFARALRYAFDFDASCTHAMLLQDDAILSRNIDRYLEAVELPAGWLSLYTQTPQDRPGYTGWHLPRGALGGAVAYLIPRELGEWFLREPPDLSPRQYASDAAIYRWCLGHDVPYYCHSPSLAQHVGEWRAIGYPESESHLPLEAKRRAGRFCEDALELLRDVGTAAGVDLAGDA